jgi:glycosidase
MKRLALRCGSWCAVAALAAIALVGGAAATTVGGPPAGAALAALSDLPTQSSLASQRIYFVMPDRYSDGVPANDTGGLTGGRAVTGFDPTDTGYFHGGDLNGLAERLQRIKDLGFTALWLTPVLKQQAVSQGSAAYHGYWGLDFTTVDPHLGTNQDFIDLVDAAHGLGLKVYLDVVVNHTADVVQLTGSSYTDLPYRDCHGTAFNPARYAAKTTFPCLRASTMPRVPFVLAGDRHAKKPAWLNDPLNYHDRGNIDFGSCSETCFEQGDFFGLDDLFTEKPSVMNGLAQIYASWITRFKVDGFRVDTAKHVNAAFFKLWVPKVRAAAASIGVKDFPIFGEVTLNDAVDLSAFVRDRGLPQVLDFPFQQVAAAYASGVSGSRGVAQRINDDDYFRTPNGVEPSFTTFLGNHDMGRAAMQIVQQAPGLSGSALVQRMQFAYDVLYLLRGAPAILYGDEIGMTGSGGDKAARQDMFPTRVGDWQTETRVGSPPIGNGSGFDVANNPLGLQMKALAAVRDAHPELSSGASVVRAAAGAVLVISRLDLATGHEVVTGFNNGTTPATVTVPTSSPSATWSVAFGTGSASGNLRLTIPPVSAVVAVTSTTIPKAAPGKPALTARADDLTAYYRLGVTGLGSSVVSLAFAIRRHGGAWQRVAIDDSAPYRAFLTPTRFTKHEKVEGVAVARGLDGTISVSKVASFVPNP